MALKLILVPAALIVLGLCASEAVARNDVNGPRSEQSQGNSAVVKPGTTGGLGQNSIG